MDIPSFSDIQINSVIIQIVDVYCQIDVISVSGKVVKLAVSNVWMRVSLMTIVYSMKIK